MHKLANPESVNGCKKFWHDEFLILLFAHIAPKFWLLYMMYRKKRKYEWTDLCQEAFDKIESPNETTSSQECSLVLLKRNIPAF